VNVHVEMALAQKCSLLVSSASDYAGRIRGHMCCSFPLSQRGQLPQRCVCPPAISIHSGGLCSSPENKGLAMCTTETYEKMSHHKAARDKNLNMSLSDVVFKKSFIIDVFDEGDHPYKVHSGDLSEPAIKELIASRVRETMKRRCLDPNHGQDIPRDLCKAIQI
jgi:hypothetical protein